MSYHLFLDLSSNFRLGLFSTEKNSNWIINPFETLNLFSDEIKIKNSILLHKRVYEILKLNKMSLKEIAGILCFLGPGSYTGVRLAHSFGLTLELFKKRYKSFHYQDFLFWFLQKEKFRPKQKYYYLTNAFKGETYVLEFNAEKIEYSRETLVRNGKPCFLEDDQEERIYFLHKDQNLSLNLQNQGRLIFIEDVLEKYLFNYLQESSLSDSILKREPFYFRPEEVEFKCYA